MGAYFIVLFVAMLMLLVERTCGHRCCPARMPRSALCADADFFESSDGVPPAAAVGDVDSAAAPLLGHSGQVAKQERVRAAVPLRVSISLALSCTVVLLLALTAWIW